MQFDPPLAAGRLVRRYKRFLADIETITGEKLTIHCPNTGAMLGCDVAGSEVWYSRSTNPGRKYAHTLEVVVTDTGRAGVNSARANALVAEWLVDLRSGEAGGSGIPELERAQLIRAEAGIPDESGRFDFLLRDGSRDCYLEVKNVTLCDAQGVGSFPDAVSTRGLKHVQALERRVAAGERGVLLFCAQHSGVREVTVADAIDAAYASAVRVARKAGVEVYACGCLVSPEEIRITGTLPVVL